MSKAGILGGEKEETPYMINNLCSEVQVERKRGFQFPREKKVESAIPRDLAFICENQTEGCLPCHNHLAQYPLTCSTYKRPGSPQSAWGRQPKPEPTAPQRSKLPALPGDHEGAPSSQIEYRQPAYAYIRSALAN